jgi:hypothetical protein
MAMLLCQILIDKHTYRAVARGAFVYIERADKDAMGNDSWTSVHAINILSQPSLNAEKILAAMLANGSHDKPDNYREG